MLVFLFSHLDVRSKIMALIMLMALPFSFKTPVEVFWVGFRLPKCHC